MGTTGGLGRVRRLSPVRLRSHDRGHRLLNELFSRLCPSIPPWTDSHHTPLKTQKSLPEKFKQG